MKKSLFVAGLDFCINDENLAELFATFGNVESAKVITDRYTGKSRGFGFVEMASPEEAKNCIDNLNNAIVKNRQLLVKIKEEKPKERQHQFNKKW